MSATHHRNGMRSVVVMAVLVTACLMMAGRSYGADAPGLQLSVSTTHPTYAVGADVPLSFVVTNASGATCAIDDSPLGSVRVLSATRNGRSVSPIFTSAAPVQSSDAVVVEHVTPVRSGAHASFTLDADGSFGMWATTPQPDDSDVLTRWPLTATGAYEFHLIYAAPVAAGASACSGASNVVTVRFAIGEHTSGRSWWLWWGIGGAAAIVILGVLIWLILRTRRRGAVVAAAVLALVAGVLSGGFAHSQAADADVSFYSGNGPDSKAASDEFGSCIGEIGKYDHDLMNDLNKPGAPTVRVLGFPDSEWIPEADGSSLIGWAWNDRSRFGGERPGVDMDPCSELYHELNHARDYEKNLISEAKCAGSNVYSDEIRATIAENGYRVNHGFLPRTNYDGYPLSAAGKCPNGKPKAGKRHCSATACAFTNGDPHLYTFDGVRYNFQAVGEFTAVASTAGDMTVQVRQQPYQTSRVVSINTAIAIRIGASRLGFYLRDGGIVTHRDGQPVTFPSGTTAIGGGTVSRDFDPSFGDEYTVTWPDGSTAWIWRATVWGLAAQFSPAASRAGTLSGLLGNFDGNGDNDMRRGQGGTVLTQPPSFQDLYPGYADSWRITDATSLFDYAAGTSTKTFTDETFPSEPVTLSAAQTAAAKQACLAVGVIDPADLADCELDVAQTGQVDFATSVAAVDTGGSTASPAPTGGITRALSVASAGAVARTTFDGKAGERAYVQVVSTTLPLQCGTLVLRGPDDNVQALGCSGPGGDITSRLLPTSGTYTVVLTPTGGVTGQAQIRVYLTTDTRVASSIGAAPTMLSVTTPGARAGVTFSATAGQSVFVTISGSTFANVCGSVQLVSPTGDVLRIGCVISGSGDIDATTLATAGTYQVLLAPSGAQTGRITVAISDVTDQALTATLGGPPVRVVIAKPGEVSRVTFTAAAGQKITVSYASSTFAQLCGLMQLDYTNGDIKYLDCPHLGSGSLQTEALPAAGRYTLSIDPPDEETGSMSLSVSAG